MAGGSRGGARFRWGLVAGEVARSFALLVGSVMVVTSLSRISSRDPGSRPKGLVDVEVYLPSWAYRDSTAWRQAFDAMEHRVRSLVGVKAVALSPDAPPKVSGFFEAHPTDGNAGNPARSLVLGSAFASRPSPRSVEVKKLR